jgi:two-component system, sensor histidine kinase
VEARHPKDEESMEMTERGARHVLVIDDNDDAREALQDLCEMLGYKVTTAADGIIGVQKAIEEKPTLMLIDIGLPEIDGYEVARRIRAALPHESVHLVALTGYSGAESARQAREAGFDLHVIKPIGMETLKSLLRDPATATKKALENHDSTSILN